MRCLLSCLALSLLCVPSSARADKGFRTYVVQPGDSCWSIAERVFGKGTAYKVIHQHNPLGPMPHVLTPGQKLRLPGKRDPYEARLDWLRRSVEAKSPRAATWSPARNDMGLWKLHKVSTGPDSSAGIRFEDDSHLGLKENALLVIYGTARRSRLSRRARAGVVLERGTLRGGLDALDAASSTPTARPTKPPPLKIKTPSADVALTATDAQVEVDEAKTSVVSVFEGRARVAAQGRTVTVPEDHGSVVEHKKKPSKPKRLPRPPRWVEGVADTVVLVPRGGLGRFEARWKRVRGARRYRVEWAKDRRFRQPIVEAEVGAGILRFEARDLKPGTYYARAAAIDARRLQSRSSKVITVEVLPVDSSRALAPGSSGVLEAVGLLRLDVPDSQRGAVEIDVDGGGFRPAAPIRLSTPGEHILKSRHVGGTAISTLKVRLLGVIADVAAPKRATAGESVDVSVAVRDERGRPAAVPGLRLVAAGAEVPLEAGADGRHHGRFDVPGDVTSLHLQAAWAGGAFERITVEVDPVETSPAPPAAVGYEWPIAPAAFAWSGGAGAHARGARPSPRAGLFVGVNEDDGARVISGLEGELGLGPVAVDLRFSWLSVDPDADPIAANDLGGLNLGLRGFFEVGPIDLAAGLSVDVPVAVGDGSTAFEPGLQLGAPVGPMNVLTNQFVPIEIDGSDVLSVGWAATWGVTWNASFVDVALEVDSYVPIFEASDESSAALAIGGAVYAHLGRIRLGLRGSGGLNEAGRQRYGRYSAVLAADLGLGNLF